MYNAWGLSHNTIDAARSFSFQVLHDPYLPNNVTMARFKVLTLESHVSSFIHFIKCYHFIVSVNFSGDYMDGRLVGWLDAKVDERLDGQLAGLPCV